MTHTSGSLTHDSPRLKAISLAVGLIATALGTLAIVRDQPHRIKAEGSTPA